MPKSSLFNALERILKRSKIKQLPVHSLCLTDAVLLIEAGSSMKYIQKNLAMVVCKSHPMYTLLFPRRLRRITPINLKKTIWPRF